MRSLADQLDEAAAINRMIFPDLWQQQAVSALREGRDVVVHAPTGAGKTLIFEVWSKEGKTNEKAVYTVPTRALANDKLNEWRAKGWNVGISTGDLSENLDASIIVATLETQKARLLEGEGPKLLVIDEYQMLGDEDRGLNYELAIAQAPPSTQLLMLSGSVANPRNVVNWLERLGRKAELIRTDERPVPLEEVAVDFLNYQVPSTMRSYWPRFVSKALADDLGPILIFAPHRRSAESIARELARKLPNPDPLELSEEQQRVVGPPMADLLKARVCFHHSGLSYGARAGVIEPLAKNGQLRVVVATMGLAAGINFSLRSVALAGESYRKGNREHVIRADEILQMFGRAGRRGIDETGYVLVSNNGIRLRDAYACQLSRNGMVDWGALLWVMHGAAQRGASPLAEAVRVQSRLFGTKPVNLGVEFALEFPEAACGLRTDAERSRRVRKRVKEYLDSEGQWQSGRPVVDRPLREVLIHSSTLGQMAAGGGQEGAVTAIVQGARAVEEEAWHPLIQVPSALEGVGHGNLVELPGDDGKPHYGRRFILADRAKGNRFLLAKWLRRGIRWKNRQVRNEEWTEVEEKAREFLALKKTPVVRIEMTSDRVLATVAIDEIPVRAVVDDHGRALRRPPFREVLSKDCAACRRRDHCASLSTSTGAALLWRRLNLIDADGVPTLRGRIVSFFSNSQGLAIAAALEKESYRLDDLVYDLANLDAGHRFCGEEARYAGKLAKVCQDTYGNARITGYLENGIPPDYGSGAEEIAESAHKDPLSRSDWTTEILGSGDIDRMIIEWRSLLRRIVHSPDLDWGRWTDFKALAGQILQETESPTITELPSLSYKQGQRISHRLRIKRY